MSASKLMEFKTVWQRTREVQANVETCVTSNAFLCSASLPSEKSFLLVPCKLHSSPGRALRVGS